MTQTRVWAGICREHARGSWRSDGRGGVTTYLRRIRFQVKGQGSANEICRRASSKHVPGKVRLNGDPIEIMSQDLGSKHQSASHPHVEIVPKGLIKF